MKENPYASLESAGKPIPVAKVSRKPSRFLEAFHNTFRGVFAFLSIGIVPIFVVGNIAMMFEEFGIELPLLTQLILRFSSMATQTWFLFLPVCLCVFAGIELSLFKLSHSKFKALLNVAYWLALIFTVGAASFSLWVAVRATFTTI